MLATCICSGTAMSEGGTNGEVGDIKSTGYEGMVCQGIGWVRCFGKTLPQFVTTHSHTYQLLVCSGVVAAGTSLKPGSVLPDRKVAHAANPVSNRMLRLSFFQDV